MSPQNPLVGIQELGQSVWMDFIHSNMILSGELARMIEHDDRRGVTSNPSIFDHAIADSSDYDVAIPGRPYSFGVLREAQVRGDLEALGRHGRTALRVHVKGDPERALAALTEKITAAVREVAE